MRRSGLSLGDDGSLSFGLGRFSLLSFCDQRLGPSSEIRYLTAWRTMEAAPAIVFVEAERRDTKLHPCDSTRVFGEVAREASTGYWEPGHLLDHADAEAAPIRTDVRAPGLAEGDEFFVLTPNSHGPRSSVAHRPSAHGVLGMSMAYLRVDRNCPAVLSGIIVSDTAMQLCTSAGRGSPQGGA